MAAGLTVPPKAEGRFHQRADLIDEEAGGAVEAGQFLAVAPFEFGLVVPGIDVAWAAVDEQPDDGAGLAGEVARARRERVQVALVGGIGGEQTLTVEQTGEGERAEAHAGAAKEVAPRR